MITGLQKCSKNLHLYFEILHSETRNSSEKALFPYPGKNKSSRSSLFCKANQTQLLSR
jgi:hypothetical protein